YDERNKDLNRDETFGDLIGERGKLVVAGSGVGGTGAAVGPTLAKLLAQRTDARVMAVMILNWFAFDENEGEDERRIKAQLRNRIMRENANSALEYYGNTLSESVAAVPVGMPSVAYLKRRYTGDVSQPVHESFIHAAAALCAERHFLHTNPFGPGLYALGAIDRGRLDGATAIPGGTLQGLANQAATLAAALDVWQRLLVAPQTGRVRPAIYDAVTKVAEPARVAEFLNAEIAHYREQLDWLRDVLAVEGSPVTDFTQEAAVRRRLAGDGARLEIAPGTPPEQVPAALFQWTAAWIRRVAKQSGSAIRLTTTPGEAMAPQWPDYNEAGIGVAVRTSGDLTRVPDQNISAVLTGFVDRLRLSANGWPHPIAAADFFRNAIDRRDPLAQRQLELLLLGMMAGRLEVRPIEMPDSIERSISLECLAAELRRRDFPGLAEHGLYAREQDGVLLGFTSPHTLLCPVPFMDDDDDNRLWQRLWVALSGDRSGELWSRAPLPASWGDNDAGVAKLRTWINEQKRLHPGAPPAWTRAFETYDRANASAVYGRGARVPVLWSGGSSGVPALTEVDLPTADAGALWVPPAGTAEILVPELLAAVPEVERLLDEDGVEKYARVEFDKPEVQGKVTGFWEEHLNLLRERRKIYNWSRTNRGEVLIAVRQGGSLKQTVFPTSEVLSRAQIGVARCIPFTQRPVPGSETPQGASRYPDLPLRSEYLDLVLSPEGRALGDALRGGDDLRPFLIRPDQRHDNQERLELTWNLRLRGRRDALAFYIRLEPRTEGKPDTAHLMVWPRFRDPDVRWKAYYVYEHCSSPVLSCD
ncbi:MAG TPA: hypothetical protein VGE98_11635, partial [Thermoanaerobaculia bacterium]